MPFFELTLHQTRFLAVGIKNIAFYKLESSVRLIIWQSKRNWRIFIVFIVTNNIGDNANAGVSKSLGQQYFKKPTLELIWTTFFFCVCVYIERSVTIVVAKFGWKPLITNITVTGCYYL